MLYNLPDLRSASLNGKTVFLRADLDVPLSEVGSIEDDTRLKAWLPTLQYLLEKSAKVIIVGKLGRPQGVDPKLSLEPVVVWLRQKFQISNPIGSDSNFKFQMRKNRIGDFEGWQVVENVFLLENLQFDSREKANDLEFTQKLASLADIYVNDAFAMCHRNHSSVVGVPKILPHFAGFRLQEEIKTLEKVLDNPARPLVVVIGGAKVETKLPLVSKMCSLANSILVGGKIAMQRKELLSAERACKERCAMLFIADLNFAGTDVSERSLLNFVDVIKKAKTVVWNGPIGQIRNSKFEIRNSEDDTEKGTRKLAKAIAESGAYTVVGGGDTLEFLNRAGLVNKFSFVSTGGGAMLAFLSGEKLPGLEALMK